MLSFKQLALEDGEWLRPLLINEKGRDCEYTFGNLYIWEDRYCTRVARFGDMAVIRFDCDGLGYLFPIGNGDLKQAITEMIADSKTLGRDFILLHASKEDCERIEALFPGEFEYTPKREYSDYVYNYEDLAELPGKKYHKKRNHISKFERENEGYRFVEINQDNIARVVELDKRWYERYFDGDASLASEHAAIGRALTHFDELKFQGGFIERADGEAIAYSLGEPINDETFCVHIEKAFHDIDGCYTVINREFVTTFCSGYRFIDREDDVGEEGLRKAKLSYYPEKIQESFFVTRR